MDRRRFLRVSGVAATAGLAGCGGMRDHGSDGGGDSGGAGGGSDGDDGVEDETATDTGDSENSPSEPTENPIDHPAAAGLADQPRLGTLGGHVVLAFEDPSCPTCKAFHRQTVPDIKTNLVESGTGAYVYRNYPVIYPWGKPATQALEATFARDGGAFWSLLDHYFTEQGTFTTDNVLEKTASFLDSNTNVDGTAVTDDARAKAFDAAVQADITAAENADLPRRTPTILLFRDGEYVTTASGAVSYEVIASALGEQ